MKILLIQDVPKLGRKGEIKDVSGGYAKNALFPKKYAVLADKHAIEKYRIEKEHEEKDRERKIGAIATFIPKIHKHTFQFQISVGKNGEVFDSLHDKKIDEHIAEFCLKETGVSLDIKTETKPLKQIGKTKIPVQFGRGDYAVKTEVEIEITAAT